ncbi:hypothetical protein G9A89_002631 [Geosiphon pyriformis]|nr:hypothetical protein G9A89_002631 [Geosiphon pyriformis]
MPDIKGFMEGLLEYETFKIVKVQDKRLGVIYRAFQIAIFVYIIYKIVMDQGYLKKEPPVPGAVRMSLKAPKTLSTPDYCDGALPCVYWGANDILYPSDGAGTGFFTTRVAVNRYNPENNCTFIKASRADDPCIFDLSKTKNETLLGKSYIADIENYTVMIEHSIRGQTTSIGLRNGLMDGKLVNSKGKTVKTWTNATRTAENPQADGDILTIKEILDAAGANLEANSTAPGAKKGETYRSSGIVIVIVIDYKNVPFKDNVISYTYYPQMIDGNEYKTTESIYQSDGSYIIKDRHGIRLVFQQYGSIGVFDFISLLQNIVAGFALFSLATLLVEILMLQFLPEKKDYEEWKFETTHDFDLHRKEKQKKIQSPEDETAENQAYYNQTSPGLRDKRLRHKFCYKHVNLSATAFWTFMAPQQLFHDLSCDFGSLFNNQKCSDIRVIAGDGPNTITFHAHGLVLATRSRILPLPSLVILRYMYSGEIELDEYGVPIILEFFVAAEELILEKLINHLEDYLIEHHAKELKENFLTLRETSYKYPSFKKLQNFFTEIAVKNSAAIFNSRDFTSLDKSVLVSFLQGDLFDLREAEIWEKVVEWGVAKLANKIDIKEISNWTDENFEVFKEIIEEFLPLIRFFHISSVDFYPADFHRLCDNKGATVSVIKVKGTGQLIGGYNPQSWSCKKWLDGKGSFIFSLGDGKAENAKLSKSISEDGPYDSPNRGPEFGELSIIMKSEDFQNKPGCSCGKDTEYEHAIMPNLENGKVNFLVEEYEVFQIRKHETRCYFRLPYFKY